MTATSFSSHKSSQAQPPVSFSWWLNSAIALVFLMVAIGGLTRLTESGLSIVEWKLMSGIFPPLSAEGWAQEFAAYQLTPEYIHKNSGMTLEGFQQIFWLEYIHRLLGRVIGLWFLLPFLYYAARRSLPASYLRRMGGMLLLVCMQGTVGWYMVKSGLIHDPWVSPYRLAIHLSLAATVFALLWWTRFHVTYQPSGTRQSARLSWVVLMAIAVQIIFGAFVAGLDAGLTYNSFPLMDGQWIPNHLWMLDPWYRNVFEHIPMVQFIHRWYAFVVLALIMYQWLSSAKPTALWVVAVAIVQVTLGIATLLSVVDITLASVHQLVAFLLIVVQLRHLYGEKYGVTSKNRQKTVSIAYGTS